MIKSHKDIHESIIKESLDSSSFDIDDKIEVMNQMRNFFYSNPNLEQSQLSGVLIVSDKKLVPNLKTEPIQNFKKQTKQKISTDENEFRIAIQNSKTKPLKKKRSFFRRISSIFQ